MQFGEIMLSFEAWRSLFVYKALMNTLDLFFELCNKWGYDWSLKGFLGESWDQSRVALLESVQLVWF